MPKKFTGLNSKAAAAKARKDEKAQAEREKAEKDKEDALWAEEEDKNVKKKRERKEREEKKRQEAIEKKMERQKQLEEEEEETNKGKAPGSAKMTRQQIKQHQEQQQREREEARAKEAEETTHMSGELEENLNRVKLSENEASNIDDAIQVLSGGQGSTEKHPEKRMKAAFEAFEKERLPQLKQDNPNLRLSQLKQMMRKEWMKHPSNPMNKNLTEYNAKRN